MTHELFVDLRQHSDPSVLALVRKEWEAHRPLTGWTRSADGERVANGPFPHHVAEAKAEASAEAIADGKMATKDPARANSGQRKKRSVAASAGDASVSTEASRPNGILKEREIDLANTDAPCTAKRLRRGSRANSANIISDSETNGAGVIRSASTSGALVTGIWPRLRQGTGRIDLN